MSLPGRIRIEQLDEAEALFTESLSLYREIDDLWSAGSSLGNLASLALTRGDAQRARVLAGSSEEGSEEIREGLKRVPA